MPLKYFFISDAQWFESTALKNPICVLDHNLETSYPEFYKIDYDVRLLATGAASQEEKASPLYNDYRERYGVSDIASCYDAMAKTQRKYVFLNGFNQKQFSEIAPMLKDSAEVLYFFKCPQIRDLSILSQFKKLRCVHIYGNNSLERLWNMECQEHLKVISCVGITKLRDIEALRNSFVEYLHLDGTDNAGRKKKIPFDPAIFGEMPGLKQVSLEYKD